jgi:hypothetical protein
LFWQKNTTVPLDSYGVPGGMQRLGADHDRVQVEVVLRGIPAAVADPRNNSKSYIGPSASGLGGR